MSRSRNYDKEIDKYDKYKHENEKLKKEVKRLRKQLSQLEIRYHGLDEMVEQQNKETKPTIAELMKKWGCKVCQKDYLKLLIITRPDGMFYFRRCSCGNKTRLKRYTEGVEGAQAVD